MILKNFVFYISLSVSSFLIATPVTYADYFGPNASYAVYFTPRDNCTLQVVEAIDKAKHSIYLQAYFLTSEPIVSALLEAKKRGIAVSVMLDKNHREHLKPIQRMQEADIPVWVDQASGIAHNKVIVIDEKTVITGSFNFTYSANHRNRENILFIQDKGMAKHYAENWYRCQINAVQEKPLRRHAAKKSSQPLQSMTKENRMRFMILSLGAIITILWYLA